MSVFVKICGVTRLEDALCAATAGASFIGVIVEIEGSPRSVSVNTALTIIAGSPLPVVLLLEKSPSEIQQIAEKLKPFAIQLVGDMDFKIVQMIKSNISARLWKTIHLPKHDEELCLNDLFKLLENYRAAGIDTVVLDTLVKEGNEIKKGGTGQIGNWSLAKKLASRPPLPIFLAGGITPENVRDAISQVHPYGIDLSSGVELQPGVKDPQKIYTLMRMVNAGKGGDNR